MAIQEEQKEIFDALSTFNDNIMSAITNFRKTKADLRASNLNPCEDIRLTGQIAVLDDVLAYIDHTYSLIEKGSSKGK